MRNLMKVFLVVIFCTTTTGLFAQSFVIKGGLNLANILDKDDDGEKSDYYKMNPGFQVGATAEFPLSDAFSFETGLLLSTKGSKMVVEESLMGQTYKLEGKLNLLYLDVPLTAKVGFDLGGARLYGVFGPYVGMGLTGKIKSSETSGGETETEEIDVKWGSKEDEDHLKRLDYGLTMGAGIEIGAIQLGATYGLGLANLTTLTDGSQMKNRVIGITLGYKFGGE